MRILITGSLVFLIWVFIASWFYVKKIKPDFDSANEPALVADTVTVAPAPPPAPVEIKKPETIVFYFDYNKDVVITDSESNSRASEYTDWLLKNPQSSVLVTGHTDSKGTDAYNFKLGLRRAEKTKKFLSGLGIPPEKIKTESKGEKEPVSENSTKEGRAKNRRTVLILN